MRWYPRCFGVLLLLGYSFLSAYTYNKRVLRRRLWSVLAVPRQFGHPSRSMVFFRVNDFERAFYLLPSFRGFLSLRFITGAMACVLGGGGMGYACMQLYFFKSHFVVMHLYIVSSSLSTYYSFLFQTALALWGCLSL